MSAELLSRGDAGTSRGDAVTQRDVSTIGIGRRACARDVARFAMLRNLQPVSSEDHLDTLLYTTKTERLYRHRAVLTPMAGFRSRHVR